MPTWSISTSPRQDPYPTHADEVVKVYQEAFDLAYRAGARGQMETKHWRELEPLAGVHSARHWQEIDDALRFARDKGLRQFIGIQVINTTQLEMPADLATAAFDSPAVRARFHALLDRLIKGREGQIAYLSIGNEVDAYLRAKKASNPAIWASYQAFFEDALAYAHQLDPAIQVGVTATAEGAMRLSAEDLQRLNAKSDVVIFTYYPLDFRGDDTVHVRDPSVVQGEFKRLLVQADGKPMLLQEVGYPASPLNGSSEAGQAAFIHEVFAAWRQAGAKVPFMNVFLLHDFTAAQCDGFASYYGAPPSGQASFKAFLCTLGMRQANGKERLAWAALMDEGNRAVAAAK